MKTTIALGPMDMSAHADTAGPTGPAACESRDGDPADTDLLSDGHEMSLRGCVLALPVGVVLWGLILYAVL